MVLDLHFISDEIIDKKLRMIESMLEGKEIIVAFSGGVDSSTLAAISKKSADKTLLVMQVGDSVATGEKEVAARIANDLGLDIRYLQYNEFEENENYAKNPENRCYFCKFLLHEKLEDLRIELGFDQVINGTNYSDLKGHRPGYKAIQEFGVLSPFVEAKMTKPEIRHVAKDWNLAVWNKPATPCLASRVKTGIRISSEILRRIDEAEHYLRSNYPFKILRVRMLDNNIGSIEVEPQYIPLANDQLSKISVHLKEIGFSDVRVDPFGYRPYDPSQR